MSVLVQILNWLEILGGVAFDGIKYEYMGSGVWSVLYLSNIETKHAMK